MNIVAIIQAHMGSTRLPGKVLRTIGDRTMLARVVRRASRAESLSRVVVACSTEPADVAIVRECELLGIESFRGSDADVLDRYFQASRAFPADAYVRITSDCPVIDPDLIDRVIAHFESGDFDYVSNTVERTFPRGLDTEVFTSAGLERVWRETSEPYDRVHVTPYFSRHPDRFRLGQVTQADDQSDLRWTVDTPEDLEFMNALYEAAGGNDDFSWLEVRDVVTARPEIAGINRHIRQKGSGEL